MQRSNRGFTLIELLIAIAIIGILSSIVLGAVNQARSKGKDAAAKSDLNGIRPQAALYYDEHNGDYGTPGTDCGVSGGGNIFDPDNTNNLNQIVLDAEAAAGTTAACANDNFSYVVGLPLQSGETWCADSTGYSGATTLPLTGTGSIQETFTCLAP